MINDRRMVLFQLSTFKRTMLCPQTLQNRSGDPPRVQEAHTDYPATGELGWIQKIQNALKNETVRETEPWACSLGR